MKPSGLDETPGTLKSALSTAEAERMRGASPDPAPSVRWWQTLLALVVVGMVLYIAGTFVLSVLRGDLSPEEERNRRIACELEGSYWNSFYDKCSLDEEPALP